MYSIKLNPDRRKRVHETESPRLMGESNILSGICAVVHEEELDVLGVLDEEDLVAGWGQVSGLLVAAITDLYQDKTGSSALHIPLQ